MHDNNYDSLFKSISNICYSINNFDLASKEFYTASDSINSFTSLSKSIFSVNNSFNILSNLFSGFKSLSYFSTAFSCDYSKLQPSLKDIPGLNAFSGISVSLNNFSEILKCISKNNHNGMYSFINNFEKIYNYYSKKETFNKNQIDYLNIVNGLLHDKLESVSYFDSFEDDSFNANKSSNLKPIESAIPVFYGYTYREDSNTNLVEEYNNSDFEIIRKYGKSIVKKMRDINIIYKKIYNKEMFKYNSETFELSYSIFDTAQNELAFKDIINLLYKGLYEGSDSGNNRIYNTNLPCCRTLDLLKNFRNFFDHEHSNGKKKVKEVLDYNKNNIGKNLPDRAKDWIKLQACLYKDIDIMLEEVYNYLNNN